MTFFSVVALLSLTAGTALAATGVESITYQGKLTDAAGSPLTGTYSVKFSIYGSSSGGTALSTDTRSVTAENGLFTTPITISDPKVVDGRALYLGITVGTDPEMTPRQALRPVPYALSLRDGAWIRSLDNLPVLNLKNIGGGIGLNVSTTTSSSDGIVITTAGGSSEGVVITTSGTSSEGVTATTSGVFGHGFSALASGDDAYGLYARTSGDEGHGVVVATSGSQSAGVDATTDAAKSPGFRAATQGTSSDGISVTTTGISSNGAFIRTKGPGSQGVNVSTAGNYADGVLVSTNGGSARGVRVSTAGDEATGVHIVTSGGTSPGLSVLTGKSYSTGASITTDGIYSQGINIHTNGDNAEGISVRTAGASSDGVYAYTTGDNAEGLRAYTTGKGSEGLYVQAYGAGTDGVHAYSAYGDAIYAEAGSGGGYAAQLKGNVNILSKSTGASILELGEGLDYSEGFDVSGTEGPAPGTVLVISPDDPGTLTVSREPYDRKVAGIVAGARGLGSAVKVGGDGFDVNVALAGRVYCNVDATYGAVEPGDQLTTSATPGYAMAVKDYQKAQGATIGKAMERLEAGQKGQILVLVTLQ